MLDFRIYRNSIWFSKKFIFQKMENQPWLWITFENQFRFRLNDMNNDRYVAIVD